MRPSWLPLAELSGSTKEKKPVMDPVSSTTASKWRVNKKKRGLHKPLNCRKTSAQPPAMHNADKHGPNMIGGAWEQLAALQASPEKSRQEAQRRAADGENTLRFKCSRCWDGLEYVPKDLVRHVEEEHEGNLPVFSCQTCSFSTHLFSYLQVHLLSHKDTFSSCTVCNDNVQRTWPEFTAHLTTRHCQNDKYSCETCHTFSTGDVGEFLEHVCAHNLGLESANEDLSLYARDKRRFGPKATAQTLHCQHCGYEASQKLLISEHTQAVHVCPNGKRRRTINEIKAVEPDDPIPEMTTRLTRSAVREMCWLTQDCLSLPGTEFLDKYCHLSDPQTTLKETQQFLMKSVAVETGGQKWSKALKSVLSSVPPDMNHVLKPEGITSDGSDLTVLTVKNKITVAQNGAPYGKKPRMMTSSEKESAAADACREVDQSGCQSNLCDRVTCPLPEMAPDDDASLPAQNDLSAGSRMQGDRENQEARRGQEVEEEDDEDGDGFELSSELKLTNESEEQMSLHKIAPKSKRRNRRRTRRSRRAEKRSAGLPLKIVLKKNPVKEKQWVSQSAQSPSGGGPANEITCRGLHSPHSTVQEMAQILQDMLLTEAQQEKRTKASRPGLDGPLQAIAPAPLKPGGGKPGGGNPGGVSDTKTIDRNVTQREKPLQLPEAEVGASSSAGGTRAGVFPDNRPPPTSDGGMDCQVSEMTSAGGAAPHCEASPDDHSLVTPEGKRSSEYLTLTLFSDPPAEGMSGTRVPADPRPDLLNCPAVTAIPPEPSPPSGQRWQPPPKTLERTLKLVAINPNQLVKRPAGDQPVVVLNHPDADTPEVARIMEVVSRYRGEVQKVVLSHRTASTLSATKGGGPETNKPADARLGSLGSGRICVQERFLLRLKLRRLSRKKYEVVDTALPSRDAETRFRCWFCGRVFTNQEAWVVHRRRHLMEWK